MDWEWVIIIVLFAVFAGFIVRFFLSTPLYPSSTEGFVKSSGHPDCLRTLPGSSQLLDVFSSKLDPMITEGSPDYRELELILSKMACLKQDLTSPNRVVDATRHQAFETAHDRVAVAELCGMCMSHTIAPRDLDLTFDKWRERVQQLLSRLCTAAHLSESQSVAAEKQFADIFHDVYETAKSRCLASDFPTRNVGSNPVHGGDVSGYLPEHLKDLRTYDYKYGGLSASGWN